MTPDAFRKEAERISDGIVDKTISEGTAYILDALRAVHNDAIEKMARAAANHCWDHENFDKCMALAKSLKIGDEK